MNTSIPRIEEATFCSTEHDAHGVPVRTYHVLRTCYGDLRRWHYKISMAVLEKRAANGLLCKAPGGRGRSRAPHRLYPSGAWCRRGGLVSVHDGSAVEADAEHVRRKERYARSR